mmetsp:Transcript_1528/g.4319  ORF Transcript_1528/g.4319 Transcript_1528/m.4319 type:complete len:213 (+) Transcript_1528:38-676(+)
MSGYSPASTWPSSWSTRLGCPPRCTSPSWPLASAPSPCSTRGPRWSRTTPRTPSRKPSSSEAAHARPPPATQRPRALARPSRWRPPSSCGPCCSSPATSWPCPWKSPPGARRRLARRWRGVCGRGRCGCGHCPRSTRSSRRSGSSPWLCARSCMGRRCPRTASACASASAGPTSPQASPAARCTWRGRCCARPKPWRSTPRAAAWPTRTSRP